MIIATRILLSPLTWFFLVLLFWFELKLGLVPLSALAISRSSISSPSQWHTLLTSGLTHRHFFHLIANLFLLFLLAGLFRKKTLTLPWRHFTKLALLIDFLHSLTLAILIQGISFPTYIYGSSGVVCGIASFLKRRYSQDSSQSFRLLSWGIFGIILFSLFDIAVLGTSTLSSYSHLLGLLVGVIVNTTSLLRQDML